MGGRQSRFSRLRPQGEGPEEQGGEASGRNRTYLNYEQLNKKFEESPDKTAKVHISVEESGQPLKDVVLDTTLRGLFYDTTEPKGEANLATHFLLKKVEESQMPETHTFSGRLSPVVIPYTTLWVSHKESKPTYYMMQFTQVDTPSTMYFSNKPGTSLWAIYTWRDDEEAGGAEGGEAEGEAGDKTVEEVKEKRVVLLPEYVAGGVPPRTNTIQARDHKKEAFVYNVKFSPVIDMPQLTRRQPTKAPAKEPQEPKTPASPQEPGEEEKEAGEEEGETGGEEKEPGENEKETLQPRDDPKEVED